MLGDLRNRAIRSSSQGRPRCATMIRRSGEVHGHVFELERCSPAQAGGAGEGRALVPDHRYAEFDGLGEQRPVLTVRGIEMLVGRAELEASQPETTDAVLELFDAVRFVRVDCAPANELFWVLRHIVRDDLVRYPDTGGPGLNAKYDDLVGGSARRPVILGARVVGVQSSRAA
jgi:hypothetical protein